MELARQEGWKGWKQGRARAVGARRGWCDVRRRAGAGSERSEGERCGGLRVEVGGGTEGGAGAGTTKSEEREVYTGAGWARVQAEGAEAERRGCRGAAQCGD